jgi:hypothetical protein
LGLNDFELESIKLYPNPTDNSYRDVPSGITLTKQSFMSWGKMMKQLPPIGMSHHCQLVFILSVSLLIMDKESPVCKKIMLE